MKYKQITEILISFAKHLREEEKSQKTIENICVISGIFSTLQKSVRLLRRSQWSISRSFRRTTLPSVRIP